MGPETVLVGQLGAARSRQDEPIEVGEVGSKRPSLGGTGGHVVWCSGLRNKVFSAPKDSARYA